MYYLHHFFDPDFTHTNLSPREAADGSVDYRYLGYVQNVVAGQVLAEVVDLEKFPGTRRDPRFIYREKRLPCGPNTAPHSKNPDKIVATANGYVFYHNGLICVKSLLNIRGNVGFHTGNIFFVGDLAVHGDVQTNFAVQAVNVLVKQHVESAKIKAAGNIVCLAGVKGASLEDPERMAADEEASARDPMPVPSTLLDAGGTIRLPFCENVQLRAKGNVIIDGSCLHSTIYVRGNLIIRGRLQGGSVYANGLVYVEKQLGSDYTVLTRIMMGYDPFKFLTVQKLESQIRYLSAKADYFRKQAARNEVMCQEFAPRLDLAERKLAIIHKKRAAIWREFEEQESRASQCRIVVPGKVMPGCEVGIGRLYYQTRTERENVTFQMSGDDIICTSPAVAVSQSDLDEPQKA